jgi:hypothetical protein
MEEEAYRGIFGRIVELAEEHTEGDPVALLDVCCQVQAHNSLIRP